MSLAFAFAAVQLLVLVQLGGGGIRGKGRGALIARKVGTARSWEARAWQDATDLVQGLGCGGGDVLIVLHLGPLDLKVDVRESASLLEVSEGLFCVTDAGGKLVSELANGVLELHCLLDMLASRINASLKGDIADVVKGFLDLVEEGLIVME